MSEQAEKYQRKNDFAPYTKADGTAVAEEFDRVQAHLDKIPALRNDGKGFAVSPVIPEATEDDHPATYGQLKNAEGSVQKNKDIVIHKAQEVEQNTSQVSQDATETRQAKDLTQIAAQTAISNAEIATEKARIAIEKANNIAQSAKLAHRAEQSALNSETSAKKWAANPENEQVNNGMFSAYHYAQKARKAAERAENLSGGRKDWSDIDNIPNASKNTAGVVKLTSNDTEAIAVTPSTLDLKLEDYTKISDRSSDPNNGSEDTLATIKAVKTVYKLVGEIEQSVENIASETVNVKNEIKQNKKQINLKIHEVEERLNTDKETRTIWSGNITQHSTNVIQLSESISNKTLIFYLQTSQSHSLQQNVGIHTASMFVDGGILVTSGRKYVHASLYVGGWRNCQIELIDNTQIRIIDISGLYLKQISAI